MQEVLLSINEAADLEKTTYNIIYMKIRRNQVECEIKNAENEKVAYLVKLSSLSNKAQKRYYTQHRIEVSIPEVEKENPFELINLEMLSEEQRRTAYQWENAIKAWRSYVEPKRKEKEQATLNFIEMWNGTNDFKITSKRTLERKWKLYTDFGLVAVADHRKQSKRKDQNAIPDRLEAVFLQWWLDEAKPKVSTIYRALEAWCELEQPDLLEQIPSETSFYRMIKKIPYPVVQFFREGSKALDDLCLPFLKKIYEHIDSNEVWQSDYHTLDIFVRDDVTGEVFRPHAAVWIDVRSRKILSVHLCKNSNSDGVILSFRKAAEKYGLPTYVYLDNGREYLVHDFGGRGRRKTDENAEYGSSILDRCAIKMYNATVHNGKTKVIERIFRDVKYDFSMLIDTYCGGKPEERPERMKMQTKDLKNVPLLSEVRRQFDNYVEGIYNEHKSKSEFMGNKCPNQVYADNLIVKRTATQEQLNLLLLRNERLQMVQRNGVYVKYGEIKVEYYSQLLAEEYQRRKVYVRYNPEDMEEVRIYDEKEIFITTAKRKAVGGYDFEGGTNKEAIKELNHQKKAVKQAIKKFADNLAEIEQAPELKEVMERKAQKMIEENTRNYDAKIIAPMEFHQEKAMDYDDYIDVDLSRMVANAKLNQA